MTPNEIAEFKTSLRHLTGSEQFFRHNLNRRVIYTEGVEFFAEKAGAYWFLDILATELNVIRKTEGFLSIKLVRGAAERGCRILVDDGNGNVLHTKNIHLTDLPAGEWGFFMTDAGNGMSVIMLPSEY